MLAGFSSPYTPISEKLGILLYCGAGLTVALLILVTPWAYGGVESWYRARLDAFLGGALVLAAVGSLLIARPCSLWRLCVVMAPLALLLAAAAWQWRGGLLPVGRTEIWTAGTIYPGATALAITGLLAAVAAMFLGVIVFSQDDFFTGLLVACLVSATLVGFFGIAMRLTGDDHVIRGAAAVGTPFARFVNRNNAAAFMILGLSSGIALLTSLVGPSVRDAVRGFSGSARGPGFSRSGRQATGRRLSSNRQSLLIGVLVLSAIPLAGIVSSSSRSGTISAAVLVCVGICFLGGLGRWRLALMILPAVLLASGLVVWLGLSERTVGRFESLSWDSVVSSGRIPHWIDATGAMLARPVIGAGLGTYGYAYQAYSERAAEEFWFQHADNMYVELAVEMGAVGGAILLVGLVVIIWSLISGKGRPVERTLLATLAAGELTHAVFDFGIVIPATTIPAAALAGAAVMRLLQSQSEEYRIGLWRWGSRVVTAGLALALAAGLGWGYLAQRAAWDVGKYEVAADFNNRPGSFTPDELSGRIAGLEAALAKRPGDAEGHRFLAELYYYGYRSEMAAQRREEQANLSEMAAWRTTSPTSLHRAIHLIAKSSVMPSVTRMREDDLAKRHLVPALDHYKAAASACPYLPGIRIPLQALGFLDPERTLNDTSQIKIATRLFPADAVEMRRMAPMAWTCGDRPLASTCWKKAFSVSGVEFRETLTNLAEELGEEEAVALVWPEQPRVPRELALAVVDLEDPALRRLVGERLREYSERFAGDVYGHMLRGYSEWVSGQKSAAIGTFEKILEENPQKTDLRVDFARLLWSAGEFRLAREELRRVILRDPDRTDARRLREQWIKHGKSNGRER